MTNRYWTKQTNHGTGDWTNTNMWSATSGGVGGASMPNGGDDVFFDANSFDQAGAVVTVNTDIDVRDMNWTGALYSPEFKRDHIIYCYGDVTFIAAMTITGAGEEAIYFFKGGGAKLTTNGLVITTTLYVNGGTVLTLQDDLTMSGSGHALGIYWGTLDTNNKTVNLTNGADFELAGEVTKQETLTLGASSFTCSNFVFYGSPTNVIITASTSTIYCNDTFRGNGKTYNNLVLSGDNDHTITGSNTFNTLTIPAPAGANKWVFFGDGTTQTVTDFVASGASGHVVHLVRDSTSWSIVKAGGGTVLVQYATVNYCTASPATTWYYDGTTTVTNSTGWYSSVVGKKLFGVTCSKIMGVAISKLNGS